MSRAMALPGRFAAVAILAMLLVGCTNYNYRIVKPLEYQRIISDSPVHIQTASMAYVMQAREQRLVIQIFNERDQMVQLLGNQSFIVDTEGASHPLRSVAIAPHSYTKLILPPLRPRVQDNPNWEMGTGLGVRVGSVDAAASKPVYLDYYEDTDAYYWDWDGDKPIRLNIAYGFTDGAQATDEFTIDKVKR